MAQSEIEGHVIAVGQPYSDIKDCPVEGSSLFYRDGRLEILMVLNNIRPSELESFGGPVEIALQPEGNILFFNFRMGEALLWQECPFSWWMTAEEERMPPENMPPHLGMPLYMFLVDGKSGIVQKMRVMALGSEFSNHIARLIRIQMQSPITPEDFHREKDHIYSLYPDIGMIAMRAVQRGDYCWKTGEDG